MQKRPGNCRCTCPFHSMFIMAYFPFRHQEVFFIRLAPHLDRSTPYRPENGRQKADASVGPA
ncbi:hypothetical protein HMPREF3213_03052 [Heyndrickxia coagulans]|uniref:Uncharacterized protein n=1 Tax=Heyndrickxia coagulans TaxID=1398 RepID=A0A133KFQ1_HEYCO|nr:hypothetical protein HMPREF3213_03052 [Heyndrickxia coagulans]